MTDKSLIEQYDIEQDNEIDEAIFALIQTLRRQGHTPHEIVPRLREQADALEDHFGDSDFWYGYHGHKLALPGDDSEFE